jgi:hypothetical protein
MAVEKTNLDAYEISELATTGGRSTSVTAKSHGRFCFWRLRRGRYGIKKGGFTRTALSWKGLTPQLYAGRSVFCTLCFMYLYSTKHRLFCQVKIPAEIK